ncbi:MAG: ATPase [Proteobacteria bacterium]|nr:ATPase [Pseudomonadota bacterium]MBU1741484.1 ATPase [Pseudomonadota bacterium]
MKKLQVIFLVALLVIIVGLSVIACLQLKTSSPALWKNPANYHAPLVEVIPNISLLIQMANFLFLLFALNLILFRPIRRKLQERREKFAGYKSDIEGLTARAQTQAERLDDLLDQARRQGLQERDVLKKTAQDEEKTVVDAAAEQMQAAVAEVRAQVKTELASARDELEGQVEAYSREVAEKILGRSL